MNREHTARLRFLSDAARLSALLDPGPWAYLMERPEAGEVRLTARMAEGALGLIQRGLETGFLPQSMKVLESLAEWCLLSNLPADRQKDIIRRCLWYGVDSAPQLTYRLGEKSQHLFRESDDMDSAWFFWFFGVAALNSGYAETAMPLLERCRGLFHALEGDRSWIAARAGMLCLYGRLNPDPGAEEELWDILGKLDQEYYTGPREQMQQLSAHTRMVLLRHRMSSQRLRGMLPEIEKLLAYCRATADAPVNPELTVRHCENMLCACYFEEGDFLQALQHATLALQGEVPPGFSPVPPDVLIRSNMLKLYMRLNDIGKMAELADQLTEALEDYRGDDYITRELTATINMARSKLSTLSDIQDGEQNVEDDLASLRKISGRIQSGTLIPAQLPEENLVFSQLVISRIGNILDFGDPGDEDLNMMCRILRFFLDHPESYPLSRPGKLSALGLMCVCRWLQGSPRAAELAEEYLLYRESLTDSNESRIGMERFAAEIFYHRGDRDRAGELLEETLSGVTSAWHKSVAYLDDRKICRLLLMIQKNFKGCCSLLRELCDSRALYERVLQFKDLPALAGRERNRMLRLAPVDENLCREIFRLQDRLAAEPEAGFEALRQQLQEKEALFAAKFPRNLQFTPITLRNVEEALPDGSAIAEYFFVPPSDDPEGMLLELFLLTKKNGAARLIHETISEGTEVLANAETFIRALQNPDKPVLAGQKEILRGRLFRQLLQPVMGYLAGIRTLYLAPEDLLCNLPFEILQDDDGKSLQDRFRILRLVSGRDLLFTDGDTPPAPGAFVLGDPDYDARQGERYFGPESAERDASTRSGPVRKLPFSGIEARAVSQRIRILPCTGEKATKFALKNALPCGLIHLATHGIFEEERSLEDSIFSSGLIFAGYNRSLAQGMEIPGCGNGILTADEISRMDLTGTNLVVLSACQSGLSNTDYHSTRGLLSAFSAAGVRWIISHMWHAGDLATAVLMDFFYEAHMGFGADVPEALNYAKERLRTVTVGQLHRRGWFEDALLQGLSPEARSILNQIRGSGNSRRLFADEKYWGGFVCHKCK